MLMPYFNKCEILNEYSHQTNFFVADRVLPTLVAWKSDTPQKCTTFFGSIIFFSV